MTSEKKLESPDQTQSLGQAGTSVKDGVVSSLKGINEIEAEIVSLVRNTVSTSLRATGFLAGESLKVTQEVVKGAFQATEEVGTGLILSSKSVAKGMVMGISDVGGDVVSMVDKPSKGPSRALQKSVPMWAWWPEGRWRASSRPPEKSAAMWKKWPGWPWAGPWRQPEPSEI